MLDAVPEGAVVETDLTLMARLVPQAEVYWMGNPTNPVPDYVVFDLESHVWHDDPDPDGARWATERHGVEFETVLEADSFQVATRVTP
ncbi:hypothetical protein SAMN06298212_10691 [Ruaniaceae bacterium KH17]|nr:hypothetical protein SAMN06298212_10691 [Ruaniaceae bacterium KH17]